MSKTESLSLGIEQSTLYSQQECKMSKKIIKRMTIQNFMA